MVCPENMNSTRGKRYRLRIETSQILAFNFSKSQDVGMFRFKLKVVVKACFFKIFN